TATIPIVVTSNKVTPAAGDWLGIRFYNHATSESILDYVTVDYGGSPYANIYINNSSPTIKNSIIRYSPARGIYSVGDSALILLNSTLSNNGTDGVYMVSTGDLTITGSTISNNGGYGVYVVGGGNRSISFSTIKDNTNYAMYSESPILKVNHCNITGNGNGIYSLAGLVADTRSNWWGSSIGPGTLVSSGVNFEPWLGTTYTHPFYNKDLSATLQEFSPLNNSVGYTFSISENSTWNFYIKNSVGTIIRTFSGSGTSGAVTWDGKDNNGVIVSDGTYTYQLSSTSIGDSSQSAPFIGDVVVKEGLPKAEITFPVNGQFITGTTALNIQGMATDTDFNNYKVEYGFGTSPTTWTLIINSANPVDPAGTLAIWDTSNLSGTYYTIRLSVTDSAGNTATASVEVKLFNIYTTWISNPYFSPNEDGSKDTTTIGALMNYSSNWTVDIKNSGGTVIRTLAGIGTSISAIWDGKDTAGVVQPEGEYSYTITAIEITSGTTTTKESASNITIDLTPPIAQITYPIADQEVYETVTITGTASDANNEYHNLYYGTGTNPSSYTLIASFTVNVTNGILWPWNTHTLTNGIYILKLLVMDKAGNNVAVLIPVTVNNADVSNFAASVSFNPSSNQSSAIGYTLARGGSVTIRVGTYAASFRTLIENVKRPAGENTDYWDGRNSLGDLLPAGSYLITINSATDPEPMPVTAPRIKDPLSTPTRFDPTTTTGTTISYNISKDSMVTVSIYDYDNNLIRNVATNISQLQGNNFVIWDGKNNNGNYVYPGAYIFKLIAADSDGVIGPEIAGAAQVYY
ncbi:MAG: right-handed parallel beta-helix repeat-containing protein, partial [Nitrospirae bacterium]|nr:right-handed parallel beta-helix repeat-containing protein [Nitrospirota bacterium]